MSYLPLIYMMSSSSSSEGFYICLCDSAPSIVGVCVRVRLTNCRLGRFPYTTGCATDSRLVVLYFRFTLPATDCLGYGVGSSRAMSFPHLPTKAGRLNPAAKPCIRRGHRERDRSNVVVVVVTSREKSILPSALALAGWPCTKSPMSPIHTYALLTHTGTRPSFHTRNLSTFLRSSSAAFFCVWLLNFPSCV